MHNFTNSRLQTANYGQSITEGQPKIAHANVYIVNVCIANR